MDNTITQHEDNRGLIGTKALLETAETDSDVLITVIT